jgi:hypothetical protein
LFFPPEFFAACNNHLNSCERRLAQPSSYSSRPI